MNSAIDCDGVFEILTRAPFPTGSDCDEAVESHLSVCHDCRQLAEALRPAVGLIHESLAQSETLPEYGGRLANQAWSGVLRTQRFRQIGPFLAAGLAACLVLWFMQTASMPGGLRSSPSRQTAALVPGTSDAAMLRSLHIPLACLANRNVKAHQFSIEVAPEPVLNVEETRFLCCTQCHRSGGNGPASEPAIRALNTACVACHKPLENATVMKSANLAIWDLVIWDLQSPTLTSYKSQTTKSQISKSLFHHLQNAAAEIGQVVRLTA